MSTPTVAFSELSKNSKRVAEILDRAQRVHITRRDGVDLYLTTARHDQQREETADITARLLAALVRSDAGERAILRALPSVFPWVRHLSADELKQFVAELVDATYDAAQLDVHANLHRVVVEWRATARVLEREAWRRSRQHTALLRGTAQRPSVPSKSRPSASAARPSGRGQPRRP